MDFGKHPVVWSRSLKSSFKIEGYLLVIVSLVYILQSKHNPRVPFFFITSKAEAPHGNILNHLCSYVVTLLTESLILWTLFELYERGFENGLNTHI